MTTPELQAQIVHHVLHDNGGWDFTQANKRHLPRISAADARTCDDRNWQPGDILCGDVNCGAKHWHYLLF